jgi:hypothetical protein
MTFLLGVLGGSISPAPDAFGPIWGSGIVAPVTAFGTKNTELAKRLTDMGLPESEASVQVKINREAFSAWFLLAALRAIGVSTLRLE